MKYQTIAARVFPTDSDNGIGTLIARTAAALFALCGLLLPLIASATPDDIFNGSFEAVPNNPLLGLGPCVPSGAGHDYQVGPDGGQLASLDQVPWENLAAGDTVRIFYRADPYKGKFSINAHGTASAPVRVCGVAGPNGERPVIDGDGATTRSTLSYGRNSASAMNQTRGILMIVSRSNEDGVTQPEYIQVDGLKFMRAQPEYSFYDMSGNLQQYNGFGGCIWIERGHHITIADNEITDCSQAIFSRSSDGGGEALLTMDVRIAGNDISNNGEAGNETIHQTYIQSVGVTYEVNHYGPMRDGATGNSIKDRSVGAVVRYNRIESGAYAIDLVEAEDYPNYAMSDPAYRTTYVYGNQIVKHGSLAIHYGGDHIGSEDHYRKGALYFWNNTVYLEGGGGGAAYMFRLSTTDETAQVWNNVFVYDGVIQYPSMRTSQEVAAPYVTGGIVNLGVNWIDQRWGDSDPYHPVPGELNGTSNFIEGTPTPVDLATLIPFSGGEAVDTAQAQLPDVDAYPVDYQLDATTLQPQTRSVNGAAMDIGAVER
jgi:hypothetical protein